MGGSSPFVEVGLAMEYSVLVASLTQVETITEICNCFAYDRIWWLVESQRPLFLGLTFVSGMVDCING